MEDKVKALKKELAKKLKVAKTIADDDFETFLMSTIDFGSKMGHDSGFRSGFKSGLVTMAVIGLAVFGIISLF